MGKKMCELKPGEPPFFHAVGIPSHYCKKCGRVAKEETSLCKPKDLPRIQDIVASKPDGAKDPTDEASTGRPG